MHMCVDEVFGLVHHFETTSGNVHDLSPTGRLLHGSEKRVWTDAGYRGIEKRPEHPERAVDWNMCANPSGESEVVGREMKSGLR